MAIDFDGTDDGYSWTPSSSLSQVFFNGFFNYDGAVGTKTLAFLSNGAAGANHLWLSKSAATLTWLVKNGAGTTNITAGISAATWTGVQAYASASGGTLTLGLRVWTTGAPGSFTTGSIALAMPTLSAGYFGYDGTGNFFNGRLADWYVDQDGGVVHTTGFYDALGKNYTPDSFSEYIYDTFGGYSGNAYYWPMHSASHLRDEFNKNLLTAASAPSTHASHARVIDPRRTRYVLKGSSTRRVSLGGYYKTTGNRVVLIG